METGIDDAQPPPFSQEIFYFAKQIDDGLVGKVVGDAYQGNDLETVIGINLILDCSYIPGYKSTSLAKVVLRMFNIFWVYIDAGVVNVGEMFKQATCTAADVQEPVAGVGPQQGVNDDPNKVGFAKKVLKPLIEFRIVQESVQPFLALGHVFLSSWVTTANPTALYRIQTKSNNKKFLFHH